MDFDLDGFDLGLWCGFSESTESYKVAFRFGCLGRVWDGSWALFR